MTMRALPQQPEAWRPTPGFHGAALREQSETKVLSVFKSASDDYWRGFWRDCDALMLLEYPTPPPDKRLTRYQRKPVQELPPPPPLLQTDAKGKEVLVPQMAPPPTGSWFGQKVDFPQDYHADMADWISLEPSSPRRDQVLREIAGIEMMAIANAGMTAPPALAPPPTPTSGVVEDLPDIGWTGAA